MFCITLILKHTSVKIYFPFSVAIGLASDTWIEDGGRGPVELGGQHFDRALHQETALELKVHLGIQV